MIKKFFILFVLVCNSIFGWGGQAHFLINQKSVYGFNSEAQYLFTWQQVLADHASDADSRKSQDPNEAPKHYIDIDNYSQFVSLGYIPQNLDSLINIYGFNYVYDQGILPWAIIASFDSLKANLQRLNFEKAMLIAADLGHYIGDAGMPLHITVNYNGQLTGQTGIHSRYESKMISTYLNEINFVTNQAYYISDISDFVFNFIYQNYPYVDSLLAADLTAKTTSGGSYNSTYYAKLWTLTKSFTIKLLQKSSTALSSLIYTAWVNAGKPLPTSVNQDNLISSTFSLAQNYPNPFNPTTTIEFSLETPSEIKIEIFNEIGELILRENLGFLPLGKHSYTYIANSNISSGIYFYKLSSNNYYQYKKMVLIK
jgi:hypothetical protein